MPEQPDKIIKAIQTELTGLGIRMSVFNTQVEMALDKGDQAKYAVEDAIKEQNEKIADIQKKIDILAKVVAKIAKKGLQNDTREKR